MAIMAAARARVRAPGTGCAPAGTAPLRSTQGGTRHFTVGTVGVMVTGDALGLSIRPYVLWGFLSLAMAALTAACMLRPPGVDLREDVAGVVRLRRRTVPWCDVQAVAFGRRGMLTLRTPSAYPPYSPMRPVS
jgi:hypothetical protein